MLGQDLGQVIPVVEAGALLQHPEQVEFSGALV